MFNEWDKNKSEEELFIENENIIRSVIIESFPNLNRTDYDDLYQEGAIALLNVIRKYKDGSVNIKSSSYIVHSIRNRCRRYYQYQSTSLHVSRRYQIETIKNGGAESADRLVQSANAFPIEECYSEICADSSMYDVENNSLLSEQLREILEAVDRLPNNRKKIIQEYFNCGMDIKETARKVGCTTRTVYRARAFLREKIRYLKILEKDLYDV